MTSQIDPIPENDAAGHEIVITCILDAPRDRVWKAWTDPTEVVHWWGPDGFTTALGTLGVRPDGVWKHIMHGPDGADHPNRSVFEQVVELERIVNSHGGGRAGRHGGSFLGLMDIRSVGRQDPVDLAHELRFAG